MEHQNRNISGVLSHRAVLAPSRNGISSVLADIAKETVTEKQLEILDVGKCFSAISQDIAIITD